MDAKDVYDAINESRTIKSLRHHHRGDFLNLASYEFDGGFVYYFYGYGADDLLVFDRFNVVMGDQRITVVQYRKRDDCDYRFTMKATDAALVEARLRGVF